MFQELGKQSQAQLCRPEHRSVYDENLRWYESNPASIFEQAYRQVYEKSMQDIPFINRQIQIELIGVGRWQHFWRGMMLTPWSMNLLLIPACEAGCIHASKGSESQYPLPQGWFPFVASSVGVTGAFWQSSLFSDMRLFESHMAAKATGEEVIRQLFPVSEEGMDLQRRRLFLLGSAN